MSERPYEEAYIFQNPLGVVGELEKRIAQLEAENKDFRKANEIISADNIRHEKRISELEKQHEPLWSLEEEIGGYRQRIAELEDFVRKCAGPEHSLIAFSPTLHKEAQALLAKGAKE